MKLEEKQILTLEDLAEFFHVSVSTMKNTQKRQKYIEELSIYCTFVEKRGRYNKIFYEIQEVFQKDGPEEGRKRIRNTKIYKEKALNTLEKGDLRTFASIRSTLIDDEDIKKLNHSAKTQEAYISEVMKEMFGRRKYEGGTHGAIIDKLWCCRHVDNMGRITYVPFTQEQLDYFYEGVKEVNKAFVKRATEIQSDYKNGLISKDEYITLNGKANEEQYMNRCSHFKDKYKVWPVFVPKYMVGQWNAIEEAETAYTF